ncbi:MAG: hypothetical protein LBS43_00310, partial [Prevotellaceae bacterium]|nr:hypothetical protein [Prevotellaceae bacterium]
MKYILLIMTFFCTGLVAQKNQQQHVDSLRKVISQFEGEQKISEYRKLIGRYFDNTMDTVLFQLFDDLEAETKKLGDFDQQRIYKFHRLRMYHNRYMFDKIVETAPKYLEFFRHHEKEDHIDYFNIYYMLIKSYIYTHDIETAIAETEQMYKQANAMQNKAGMAISLYTMSDIYEAQLRTEDQEKALREAIDLFENVDDINLFSLFANAYMSLCNMLISDKRLNEALEMMHKYEKLIRHAEAPRFNVWELNLIYHIQTGEYDKAEMYCDTLDNVLPLQVWQTNGSIHKIKIYAGRGQ